MTLSKGEALPNDTDPVAGVVELIADARAAAKFYVERPSVDEQKRVPHLAEISRREALENAERLYWLAERLDALLADRAQPIDMVLFCPACGEQHIDAPEEALGKRFLDPGAKEWTNPPHRSHLCHGCGHIWRPADVPTNGVAAIKTRGRNDSEPVTPDRAQLVEALRWIAKSDKHSGSSLRDRACAERARQALAASTPGGAEG